MTDINLAPLFIVGYPRSGTTLLLHLLMSFGQFAEYSFSETHFFSHYYRRYGSLRGAGNRRSFIRAVLASEWGVELGLDENKLDSTIVKGQYANEAVLESVMGGLCNAQQRSRWIEKTPWHTLYLEEIFNSFPSAKFIHIVRDPRDVCLSIEGYGWNRDAMHNFPRSLIAWKYHDAQVNQRVRALEIPCLRLRYEDLVMNLDQSTLQICEFLGIPVAQRVNNVGVLSESNSSFGKLGEGVSKAPLFRWKTKLTPAHAAQADAILGDCLERYSYERPATIRLDSGTKLALRAMQTSYVAVKKIKGLAFPVVRR
jgi:hypothetical protein